MRYPIPLLIATLCVPAISRAASFDPSKTPPRRSRASVPLIRLDDASRAILDEGAAADFGSLANTGSLELMPTDPPALRNPRHELDAPFATPANVQRLARSRNLAAVSPRSPSSAGLRLRRALDSFKRGLSQTSRQWLDGLFDLAAPRPSFALAGAGAPARALEHRTPSTGLSLFSESAAAEQSGSVLSPLAERRETEYAGLYEGYFRRDGVRYLISFELQADHDIAFMGEPADYEEAAKWNDRRPPDAAPIVSFNGSGSWSLEDGILSLSMSGYAVGADAGAWSERLEAAAELSWTRVPVTREERSAGLFEFRAKSSFFGDGTWAIEPRRPPASSSRLREQKNLARYFAIAAAIATCFSLFYFWPADSDSSNATSAAPAPHYTQYPPYPNPPPHPGYRPYPHPNPPPSPRPWRGGIVLP